MELLYTSLKIKICKLFLDGVCVVQFVIKWVDDCHCV